jgi:hypothetical protein
VRWPYRVLPLDPKSKSKNPPPSINTSRDATRCANENVVQGDGRISISSHGSARGSFGNPIEADRPHAGRRKASGARAIMLGCATALQGRPVRYVSGPVRKPTIRGDYSADGRHANPIADDKAAAPCARRYYTCCVYSKSRHSQYVVVVQHGGPPCLLGRSSGRRSSGRRSL